MNILWVLVQSAVNLIFLLPGFFWSAAGGGGKKGDGGEGGGVRAMVKCPDF